MTLCTVLVVLLSCCWQKCRIPVRERGRIRVKDHGFVHNKYISIYIQQDATLHSLFITGNCSTCFGWYLHRSSGAHTTVSTASGTCQTVTARRQAVNLFRGVYVALPLFYRALYSFCDYRMQFYRGQLKDLPRTKGSPLFFSFEGYQFTI